MLDALYPPLIQQDPLIAQAVELVAAVTRHHHRRTLFDCLLYGFEENARHLTVECRGRLVQQQQPRPDRESAGERNALALSAGQIARVLVQLVAEAHALEPFRGMSARRHVVHASGAQRQLDVLSGRLGLE
jgi:hypothetical protein